MADITHSQDGEENQLSRRSVLDATVAGAASTTVLFSGQALAEPDQSRTDPWPMEGSDAARKSLATESAGPTGTVTQDWVVQTQDGDGLAPIITQSAVIVGSGRPETVVTALNPNNGQTRWSKRSPSYTYASPVAVGADIALLHNNGLIIRNIDNGNSQSQEQVNNEYRFVDLVRTTDRLFFAAESGVVGSIPRINSANNWQFETELTPVKIAAVEDTLFIITKGKVKETCTRTGRLIAVDVKSGSVKWRSRLPAGGRALTVANERVVVGVVGSVHGFDFQTGEEVWRQDTKTEVPAFAASNGTLVVGGYREVWVADVLTGKIKWVREVNSQNISPAISGRSVFITGSGPSQTAYKTQLMVSDLATGSIRSTHGLSEDRISKPAVGHGAVYVRAESGAVYAFTGGQN